MNDKTQQPQDIQDILTNENNDFKNIDPEKIVTPEMLDNLKMLKNIADKDFQTIDNLISVGDLQEKEGQILKNEVLKNMFSAIKTAKTNAQIKSHYKNQVNKAEFGETAANTKNQSTNSDDKTSLNRPITPNSATQNINFDELKTLGKSYPTAEIIEFLTREKNYQNPESLSELVKIIEANAVKNYIEKENLTKKQQAENELAKQKLVSSITNGKTAQNGMNKIFTRESLKKLTPAEFKQYEEIIAKQIEMGLLK